MSTKSCLAKPTYWNQFQPATITCYFVAGNITVIKPIYGLTTGIEAPLIPTGVGTAKYSPAENR